MPFLAPCPLPFLVFERMCQILSLRLVPCLSLSIILCLPNSPPTFLRIRPLSVHPTVSVIFLALVHYVVVSIKSASGVRGIGAEKWIDSVGSNR